MALITCPECGKEISDKAAVCPSCGAPISAMMGNLYITRESSEFMTDEPLQVVVDDSIEFTINMDETLETKVAFGTHNMKIKDGERVLAVTDITVNEDYFFIFKMGDNKVLILNNSGASTKKNVPDVGRPDSSRLICPKCHSQNVNVQMVTEQKLQKKKHGPIYWIYFILIGWVFKLIIWCIKWFVFTVPALIITLFKLGRGKDKQLVTTHKSVAVCQGCGYHWEVGK